MIAIDIIRKKRASGTTGGSTAGTGMATAAGGSTDRANEADHAQRADNATHADTAKELDGDSTVWATIRSWIANVGESVKDMFLRKDVDDETTHKLTMNAAEVKDALTVDGNVVVDVLSSISFDEALQRGFGVTKDAQGKYTLSVTDLVVWGKAVFNSLETRKLYAVGGNVYLSGASSKLQYVVPVTDADGEVTGWKCYILNDDGTTATQNGWRKYDQAKCQTFDIKEGAHEGVKNTYYWRLVTDVSTENETITETYTDADGKEQTRDLYDGKKFGWVILSKTDCESATNDAPKAGDTIVLDGHRMFASGDAEGRDQYNDESRTNVMMLETTGVSDGSLPRIVALTGITDYRHSDGKNEYSNTVFILSPKEVVFVSSCIKWISASGDPITLVNFRGSWEQGTKYAYYDQVSHDNAIWTCIVEKGTTITEEPSDTSKYWRKEISGGKDGKDGKQGDGVVMAYKHADTQPDAPTGTDPEYPGDGWSLSPDAPTGGDKVTGVSYGDYESGAYDGPSKGTDATAKEWAEAEDDGRTWMKSPSGLGNNFGYALMKVSFTTQYDNTTVDVEIKAYSEQDFDFVEVWALDTAPDTDTAFRGQGLAHASGNGVEQAYSFTVAKAGRHFICVTYAKDTSQASNGDYGLFRLDLSDNEAAVSDTVWMSQAKVSGGKCVLPWSTPVKINGADGIGALEIICDPETIVIDTDDNGLATGLDNAYASLMCLRDGKEVSDVTYSLGRNATVNCTAGVSASGVVTITRVTTQSVTTGNTTVPVSCTSGSVTVSVYDPTTKTTYAKTVPFSANVAKFNGGLKADNERLESEYTELSNNSATKDDLKQYDSKIEQTARNISLKVQDLQNGGVDTSKPHTSSQVDFRTLDADSFYPVMIRFKDDGGVRHTVEISRNLDGTYGSGKDYMRHSQGISFRLIFSDIANGWGTNEDGQLHIESISQRWTEPTDTPICPKIAQYYPFSFTLAWLRGGSKYDITVDCTDAYISGIWPYMMQVASNPSWVPDAVRLAPDTWTTAQVNAQGGNPYNMLRKDNGGYYADVDNEYLYRFGELAAGNTFAIAGQPKDSKVWFLATWHITSVSGSKVYVDVSTYGLLWQAQNPLGIRMGELGYIKTGASYPKSTWDSQNGFGTSEDVDNTAVHADWAVPRAILVIGKESSATNGVYRDRAVLEAVQSCTEGSSVSFYSNTYFDVSPLYGTDGRTNVKPDLLATGIDIKSHKIVATADNFVVRNNSGTLTFSIDEDGNIVGVGNASFKGSVTAKTFTLSSDKFYVDNNGKFKLNMTNFSVKEDGTITAKGGRISFFNFDEEGMASGVMLVSDSSQNKIAQQGLGLSSDNISVSGSANQRVSSVFLGRGLIDSRFAGPDKNHIVYRVGPYPSASTFYNYIKLEKLGNGSDSLENDPEHAALGIETQGDFCLAALGGPSLFAGMCFASNTGGSSVAADKKHCFYLCEGGRFYMPSDPPNGMLIVVIQTGGKITFYGNGHDFHSGTNSSGSCNSNTAGQWTLFYYDGNFWNTVYMNGRPF